MQQITTSSISFLKGHVCIFLTENILRVFFEKDTVVLVLKMILKGFVNE